MQKISCVIITFNEEKNIRDCLESVKWADEIIVVDQSSTDRTVVIVQHYTDKIFVKPHKGYCEPDRNFSIAQASNEWVLILDADERLSDVLIQEIKDVLEKDKGFYSGYYMPRQSFYLGRWIKYGEWNPDLKLRLIKKGKCTWSSTRVHEKPTLYGEVGYLKNPIYHYTYRDISNHLEKFNRYSSLFAQEAFKSGKKVKLYQLLCVPFIRFINGYFIKKGFLDGFAGFIIVSMQSFEVFLRYIKLWELERKKMETAKRSAHVNN